MKTLVLVIICLGVGIGLGIASTRREFASEQLPTDVYLTSTDNASATGASGPKVTLVGGSTFDFGQMDRHAEGEHVFQLRNDGDQPLRLEKGQTTCKCTMSEMKDGDLKPGETAPIKLNWTAKTGDMEFSQSAEIKTSDPRQPLVRLHVHGKIIDALRADRAHLSLGSFSASEDTLGKFKVFSFRGDQQLAVAMHDFVKTETAGSFSAEFRDLDEAELAEEKGAKSGVEVAIRVKSGLPLGTVAQTIRLTTNLAETSPLEIPIEGRVVGDIVVVGPGVASEQSIIPIGAVTAGKSKTITVHVIVKGPHRHNTELQIKNVEPKDLQVKLGEPSTDNPQVARYPLTVTIPADTKPISKLGTTLETAGVIRLSTTHPLIKEFVILVRYAVTE
ncbi:DUF1573 domain-containing protein [Anatilimnocola sp. NA78]|uniref:DUF1573 domain-containing protein n=1 Tax=Anatilimnocola sp. NA78 TaxID=3415683 RepID=UPI003CE50B70